ncbi:unnamed protein product [Allacma fusca]|uniref:Uncharacterized protein n=1 Tax=Allacma fusca TaxID=39272 RepID=A0A8J2LKW4_9HEXA|nr:unnamed protein product [Allacma fusca]
MLLIKLIAAIQYYSVYTKTKFCGNRTRGRTFFKIAVGRIELWLLQVRKLSQVRVQSYILKHMVLVFS